MASYNASETTKDATSDSSGRNFLQDAINTIFACLAVLGNGMVIVVMLTRLWVFSSFTNRLILHQSVIDAVAGSLFFLFNVVREYRVVEGNIHDRVFCSLWYSAALLWCVNVTSTYNLVIISLERFMATCYPVQHRNTWSKGKLRFAVAASWIIGFVYGSHMFFIFEPQQGLCQPVNMGVGLQVLLGVLVLATEYSVPITIMIYTYSRILILLTKKIGNQGIGQPTSLSKAKKNVLVTVLLAGIMFAVCWTPAEINYIDTLFFNDSFGQQVYVALTGVLACNMFINPVIYCFKYERFRVQLRDLLLKRVRRNRIEDELNSISQSNDP